MNIREVIENDIIKPAMSKIVKPTFGYVLEYNPKKMLASMQVRDPNTGDYIYYGEVPVKTPPKGFHPVEPEPGDRAVIEFLGGDLMSPIICSFFDEEFDRTNGPYERLTNEYAAAVPDILSYI